MKRTRWRRENTKEFWSRRNVFSERWKVKRRDDFDPSCFSVGAAPSASGGRKSALSKTMKPFRILNHTADIGLVVNGRDLKTLFENAGHAFFHLLTDLRKVRPRVERKVEVGAESLERMMVDWLSELLYLHDVE